MEIITNTKESSGDGYVTYTIPFSALTFSLNLESVTEASSTLGNGRKNLITFDELAKEVVIPITISDNVKAIAMDLPSGWEGSVDLSQKQIKLRSPLIGSIDFSDYDGVANFIAQDQEGKSTVSSVQVKLNKYLYLRYYHNIRHANPFESPMSANNKIEITGKQKTVFQLWKLDMESGKYNKIKEEEKSDKAEQEKIFKQDTGLRIPLSELKDAKHIAAVTFLYDPTTMNQIKVQGKDGTDVDTPLSQALELRKLDADKVPEPLKRKKKKPDGKTDSDEDQDYVLPCSKENYVVYNTAEIVDKSVQIKSRMRLATARVQIIYEKFKEHVKSKLSKELNGGDVDPTKIYMTISNVASRVLPTGSSNDPDLKMQSINTFLYVENSYFKYDENKDELTADFHFLGTDSNKTELRFYYGDKFLFRWSTWLERLTFLIRPETEIITYINSKDRPSEEFGNTDDHPMYFYKLYARGDSSGTVEVNGGKHYDKEFGD